MEEGTRASSTTQLSSTAGKEKRGEPFCLTRGERKEKEVRHNEGRSAGPYCLSKADIQGKEEKEGKPGCPRRV